MAADFAVEPRLIQIQVATTLSEDGVSDVRWVLLEPSEVATAPQGSTVAAAPASAPVSAAPMTPRGGASTLAASAIASSEPSIAGLGKEPVRLAAPDMADSGDASEGRQAAKTYQVLRAVVLAAALLGAWWVASSVLEHRPSGAKARVDLSAKRL
jgi:hypothetical protein